MEIFYHISLYAEKLHPKIWKKQRYDISCGQKNNEYCPLSFLLQATFCLTQEIIGPLAPAAFPDP